MVKRAGSSSGSTPAVRAHPQSGRPCPRFVSQSRARRADIRCRDVRLTAHRSDGHQFRPVGLGTVNEGRCHADIRLQPTHPELVGKRMPGERPGNPAGVTNGSCGRHHTRQPCPASCRLHCVRVHPHMVDVDRRIPAHRRGRPQWIGELPDHVEQARIFRGRRPTPWSEAAATTFRANGSPPAPTTCTTSPDTNPSQGPKAATAVAASDMPAG